MLNRRGGGKKTRARAKSLVLGEGRRRASCERAQRRRPSAAARGCPCRRGGAAPSRAARRAARSRRPAPAPAPPPRRRRRRVRRQSVPPAASGRGPRYHFAPRGAPSLGTAPRARAGRRPPPPPHPPSRRRRRHQKQPRRGRCAASFDARDAEAAASARPPPTPRRPRPNFRQPPRGLGRRLRQSVRLFIRATPHASVSARSRSPASTEATSQARRRRTATEATAAPSRSLWNDATWSSGRSPAHGVQIVAAALDQSRDVALHLGDERGHSFI